MLPLSHRIAFVLFALITGAFGVRGFARLIRRIRAGREDADHHWNHPVKRILYALKTTLLQTRTFRKRPWVSFLHSFIFYGFVFYLLVNLVDAVDGFVPFSFTSLGIAGRMYVLFADILSALVLIGVLALVARRFLLPSRRDFRFNERTMLHPDVRAQYISRDSLIVSAFILFHVGSRAVGAGAKLVIDGPNRFAPFATLISHLLSPVHAEAWRIFGYWGALGSVLAFLSYFPYSKHIHIFAAPMKYLVARSESTGTLPALDLNAEVEEPQLGAGKLEELPWPRLLDAYACIQCNRCQDACPATATGKSLSPSALEINKRMELNRLSTQQPGFERGAASPTPLLSFALSAEAAWACTTCGACLQVCPVQDEPMLDILDIRRHQVMMEGEFPAPLQSAFRGMERAKNPWGTSHEKRLDWAAGLHVKTIDENPQPDVLFWVGCAASYDPQSQKTARAFVQLMQHAEVDFAVLGKRECCTGDSARRAGNEYLFRQLADENVATLNAVKPKRIVATCPHCMNALGKEYRQFGGEYQVQHHTEFLASLVAEGKLAAAASQTSTIAFHDPCYLGRHNGVYDAPRNLLNVISNSVVELDRNRENSFCCGAGGAQFWKEEEPGEQRISDNRYLEAQQTLAGAECKVLAVGCPFCKSMLESTPAKGMDGLAVRDVAELLLEAVQRRNGTVITPPAATPLPAEPRPVAAAQPIPVAAVAAALPALEAVVDAPVADAPARKKWDLKSTPVAEPTLDSSELSITPSQQEATAVLAAPAPLPDAPPPARKQWKPMSAVEVAKIDEQAGAPEPPAAAPQATPAEPVREEAIVRKKWSPKSGP